MDSEKIKDICTRIATEFIFELNNEETRNRLKDRIQNELGDNFVVVCSIENNPAEVVDSGAIKVDIYDTIQKRVYNLRVSPTQGSHD